ncbi:acetylcholinesterase-like [Brevipalpus obovatus]|uniref:acetylcholinesterase-like n=1 Tax=Brevipalpus obovatus TaxID=246614 RepID=UPI003D9DBC02
MYQIIIIPVIITIIIVSPPSSSQSTTSTSTSTTDCSTSNQPEVVTKFGAIRGVTNYYDNKSVQIFHSIPYATSNRFQRSLPWNVHYDNGLFNATNEKIFCISIPVPLVDNTLPSDRIEQEDCLVLSVWSPNNVICKLDLKPVLIYLHGGGFHFDVSRDARVGDPSILSMMADIVIVSVKYRLGAFACMYADDDLIPGNLALDDQLLALEWIKDNIIYFGGDPNRITLSGESAGAISSGIHLIVNHGKHLFSKVILQSGNIGTDVNEDEKIARQRFKMIVESSGCSYECNDSNPVAVVECLKRLDAQKLTHYYLKSSVYLTGKNSIPPCLVNTGQYSQARAKKLLQEGYISKNIPILLTSMVDEGSISAAFAATNNQKSDINELIHETINLMAPGISAIKMRDMMTLYFGGIYENISYEYVKAFLRMIGDRYFRCQNLWFGEKAADLTKIYSLEFTHTSSGLRKWKPELYFDDSFGPRHVSELAYVFGTVLRYKDSLPKEDIDISIRMMNVWSQFIHHGTVSWPAYTKLSDGKLIPFTYVIGGAKDLNSTRLDTRRSQCEFWYEFF